MNGNFSTKRLRRFSISIIISFLCCIKFHPIFVCSYNSITQLHKEKIDAFEAVTIGRGLLAIGDRFGVLLCIIY